MKPTNNLVLLPMLVSPSGRRRPIDARDFRRFGRVRGGVLITLWVILALTLLYIVLAAGVVG